MCLLVKTSLDMKEVKNDIYITYNHYHTYRTLDIMSHCNLSPGGQGKRNGLIDNWPGKSF